MKWTDFEKRYPDEASCKAEWKRFRDEIGVTCPQCGCTAHYWKSDKECYECKNCHYRQSLRANTVMHGSQLPFRYWFMAIQMITVTKKTVSALELQRQLGHRNYRPIWAMLHKLRLVMGTRDARYQLGGLVESTESMFTVDLPAAARTQSSEQGGEVRKTVKVLVMAETHKRSAGSRPMKNGDKPTSVNFVKMHVIDDLKTPTIKAKVLANMKLSAAYVPVKVPSRAKSKIVATKSVPKGDTKNPPQKSMAWVHITIGNVKRLIDGIFHDVSPEFLQSYLNEFCYKFNRRNYGEELFDKVMQTGVRYKNRFRYSIAHSYKTTPSPFKIP